MLRKRLLALISLNALVVAAALMMTGGTAAEMSDIEASGTQSITAAKLDIVPGATAASDLDLDLSGLTPLSSVTQSFTVTNTATPTTAADIYIWLDPAAVFPFCGGTVEPVTVTIADAGGNPVQLNLCDLTNNDLDNSGSPDSTDVPFQIADGVAGNTAVTRSLELTLDGGVVPADWSNVSGSAALIVHAVQDGGPAPVVSP